MKGSSFLSLKAWSTLNPPLPRTPRQSKQLLNALTSSFRRQLDQEYPLHSSNPNSNTTENAPGRPVNQNSSVHATDHHLKSILDNPLFRVVPSKSAVAYDTLSARSAEEQRRITEQPVAVFDDRAALGLVSTWLISACLKSQLLLAARCGGSDMAKAMRDSKLGSRIVAWFWASDSAARKDLLKSRQLTAPLLKFMIVEGLQDTVIAWLRMILKRDVEGGNGHLSENLAQQSFNNLVKDYISAELQYGNGPSPAMEFYLRAYRIHSSLSDQTSRKEMLLLPGVHLLQSIIANDQGRIKDIPAPLYEEFTAAISAMSPRSLLSSAMPLYHPTHPKTDRFLKFVEGYPPEKCQSWSSSKRETLIRVSIDALRVLLDREESRRATKLAQFVQELLPKEDHAETDQKKYLASPEEDYLLGRLLGRLDSSLV